MHILTDVYVTTAALAASINPLDNSELLDKWDQGCVELYHQIGKWAAIIDKVEAKVSMAVERERGDWPGVFAYEVTENVGAYMRRVILTGRSAALTDEAIHAITLLYALEFCKDSPAVMAALVAPRG